MIQIVSFIAFALLSIVYIEHALLVFQQNRYGLDRYGKWLLDFKNIRLNAYFTYVAIAFIAEFLFRRYIFDIKGLMIIVVTFIFAAALLYREQQKIYIKPLVYTDRVKRQVIVIAIIDIAYLLILINFGVDPLVLAVIVPLVSWLLICPMALITAPIEARISKGYENEARAILKERDDLLKIAITGSYGKTSTKNVLRSLLSEKYYTLMTPASYNTPMGITRTIRENLKRIHEVFICEMGADHVDDISYLMDFVKPRYGILTSIGPQHLNTFGNLENIIKEKMQVIEKLPRDGVGIINYDNEYIRSYTIKNPIKIIKVGIDQEDVDYRAIDLKYDSSGLSFKVFLHGELEEFKTSLLGKHNIINILLAIAMAAELGVDVKMMKTAIASLRPIEHRLELKAINGYRFIDNAFNSNPISSKLSLDVLKLMPGKRVIVTPGLIDLGKDEERYNEEFGAYMKDRVDVAILIGKNRAKAIIKGLKASGFDMEKVIVKDDIYKAFAYIYENFQKDDTILLENDLPDAFSN